jgi:DNA invertase Pin-like site-specific DNA recombinase
MSEARSHSKVRADHLARPALIYIRQSTLMQVRENTASTARQYHLTHRVRELGWPEPLIVVIDQDQGRSGASAEGRTGFEYLIAEVGLGRAGAVVSLEASRLARSSSEWYRLIEICALTDTLVIDEDGIYDPGQYNDRLLLGFRGTMSEAELHWLHCRLVGGKLEKAQHGTLRFRLPVGLSYDPTGQIVLDPDEEIQQAVRLVFALFEQHRSALAVVKHFAAHGLQIPDRLWTRRQKGEVVWTPLRHARVLTMLHNPFYAGAYGYGRTKSRSRLLPGEAPRIKARSHRVARLDWPIVLRDHHVGYLSWEQFVSNVQQLDDNRTFRAEERRGAVREGSALLQGVVVCGRCGRRMSVRYMADGRRPIYVCGHLHRDFAAKACQELRGDGIDQAVAQLFLRALQPAQLQLSLATLHQLEERARALDRQWQLRLERARYEVDLARRRYVTVEPENRLVTRSLERDWNEKLTALDRLEREYAAHPTPESLVVNTAERTRILALAQDVPLVWHAPTTTAAERKQLLRLLIKDVTLTKQPTSISIAVRWQTEACSTLAITRPQRAADAIRTAPLVVTRVRELAPTHTDEQIARCLNAEGFHSGSGGTFSPSKVEWVRYVYHIKNSCPRGPAACPTGQRGDGRYSARVAAVLLNVTVYTIADWCKAGKLDGVQAVPRGPWWVALTPERIAALRKPVQQHWSRRKSGDDAQRRSLPQPSRLHHYIEEEEPARKIALCGSLSKAKVKTQPNNPVR